MSISPPTSSPVPGPFNNLIVPFDPGRGLDFWWQHLDLHTAADSKVAAARSFPEGRFEALPEDDAAAVASVMWANLRLRLRAGLPISGLVALLADGDRVLQLVQTATATAFTAVALSDLAHRVRAIETADSPEAGDLSLARGEVAQLISTDFGPATVVIAGAGFALGYGLAALAVDVEAAIHGHEGLVYAGPHHW